MTKLYKMKKAAYEQKMRIQYNMLILTEEVLPLCYKVLTLC